VFRRENVIGAVVAGAVMLLGLGGAQAAADRSASREARRAAEDGAQAVGRVDSDLLEALIDARRIAAVIGATGQFSPTLARLNSPVLDAVGFVRQGDRGFTVEGDVDLPPEALAEAVPTLDLARDTALPRITPPVGARGAAPRVYVAAAAYANTSGTGFDRVVASTDQRRAASTGWVVARVDMGALLDRAAPPGIDVEVRDAGVLLGSRAPSAEGGRPDVRVPVLAGDRQWDLLVFGAGSPGRSGAVGFVGVTVLLAVAVLMLSAWAGRARARAVSVGLDRSRELDLITSLGPVVQESMDLGRILPTIGVHLRDELGLAGVAVAIPAENGANRDVFVLGAVDDGPPSFELPLEVPAGATMALSLTRGGRSAGVLRIRAGRSLTHRDMEPVRAAAELTTAAIVNAQLFEQQDEAMRRLRDLDELKTVFLGTASHELRTPVTAIAGFATLLDQRWDEFSAEERRLFVGRIAANSNALETLVQDLLDFARLERGKFVISVEAVDLCEMVREVLDRLALLFSTHNIETDLHETGPVLADRNGIERIVTNLTANAVKYSPAGTTVTVRVAPSLGGAELIVDDQGPGVPEAERTRIFARFFRGVGEAVIRTKGTGIGLAVVKEFVDEMGGEVSVSPAPGGGARFRVLLKAANQEAS
jgi:signal transduction histidine kinase